MLQAYAFLLIAWFWDIEAPPLGYLTLLPALLLSGFMLGALGMLISSLIKQLENFAGVMNFVIFPMFFASSALYPLWRVKESSPLLYYVCELNPFTHATELIRFALYEQVAWVSLAVVVGCTARFCSARSWPTIRRAVFWRAAIIRAAERRRPSFRRWPSGPRRRRAAAPD